MKAYLAAAIAIALVAAPMMAQAEDTPHRGWASVGAGLGGGSVRVGPLFANLTLAGGGFFNDNFGMSVRGFMSASGEPDGGGGTQYAGAVDLDVRHAFASYKRQQTYVQGSLGGGPAYVTGKPRKGEAYADVTALILGEATLGRRWDYFNIDGTLGGLWFVGHGVAVTLQLRLGVAW